MKPIADPKIIPSWKNLVFPELPNKLDTHEYLIGILPGEGIGPEVIELSLSVLSAITQYSDIKIKTKEGDLIGKDADQYYGKPLTEKVIDFCADIFDSGGAILNGPGGGRYVYDLRKEFDLYFKISPLQIKHGVANAARIRSEYLQNLDVLVLRENSGGIYQGSWSSNGIPEKMPETKHTFGYTEEQVFRFLDGAGRISQSRKGKLTVVWKEHGIPGISKLWKSCAHTVAEKYGIAYEMVDVDLMAYQLIQHTENFDVIATPNLMGDIIGDLGAVLLGSRGVSFSGNYGKNGEAVYQTNHGSAYDLKGTNMANPAGQMFSLAMMLRQSFGLYNEADCLEQAIVKTWKEGFVTRDLALPNGNVLGTKEWAGMVKRQAGEIASKRLRARAK